MKVEQKNYLCFLCMVFAIILITFQCTSVGAQNPFQNQNKNEKVSPNNSEVIQNWAKLYIHFENRDRFSWGPHDQECSGDWPHNPPWGNWGVASNFGDVEDDNQFRGWKPMDGWRQWSACTVESAFDPPDVRYYNWDNYTHQKTTQAEDAYSETILCIGIPSLRADEGCSYMNGRNVTFSGSYMSVYEIDPVDEDEFIKTLYYPNLQRTMSGCTLDDCPSQASSWYNVSSWYPSSGGQVLNAQIRFVVEGCVAVDEQCP